MYYLSSATEGTELVPLLFALEKSSLETFCQGKKLRRQSPRPSNRVYTAHGPRCPLEVDAISEYSQFERRASNTLFLRFAFRRFSLHIWVGGSLTLLSAFSDEGLGLIWIGAQFPLAFPSERTRSKLTFGLVSCLPSHHFGRQDQWCVGGELIGRNAEDPMIHICVTPPEKNKNCSQSHLPRSP